MTLDEMAMAIGEVKGKVELHNEGLNKLFEVLDDIRTKVGQNETGAKHRDNAIAELTRSVASVDGKIAIVDKKIENGLRSAMTDLTSKVNTILACAERRRKEREQKEKNGLRGYFRVGWEKFRTQSSFIIITFTILSILWLLLWAFTKVNVFHEGPAGLMKWFGIGS